MCAVHTCGMHNVVLPVGGKQEGGGISFSSFSRVVIDAQTNTDVLAPVG